MIQGRKLRMGMVGGGPGAFIGRIHRMAASLDNEIELVCGAFSSDPERSRQSGLELHLLPERSYANFADMFAAEAALREGERMDFVSIVTPNFMHAAPAIAALDHGFHVICDKPLAHSLEDALAIRDRVHATGLHFALTHNYTGYPMVKEARRIVREGAIGTVRKVLVEYPQFWMALRSSLGLPMPWRTDPEKSGGSCCVGDIGTHAENLCEYVTGLELEAICADLSSFVDGHELDDDASILLRFRGGARGVLTASQICPGEENALRVRVYGSEGAVEWYQPEPNTLLLKSLHGYTQVLRTAGPTIGASAALATRLPGGHPEGFIEAFANLYRAFAAALRGTPRGDFPGIDDGVRGMQFIDAVLSSSRSSQKWTHV
ncbi:MAG: putative dehydrogenase [Rhodothermales bacterium]|jgi:predicted dehydrogenase